MMNFKHYTLSFWQRYRSFITPLTIVWAFVFLFLSYSRLNFYDGFQTLSYSGMTKGAVIGFLGFLFFILSLFVVGYFSPWGSKFKFLVVCISMLLIVYATPFVNPFEFFLLTHHADSPFVTCNSACAVRFYPGSMELGINDPPTKPFIIYAPNDTLAPCISEVDFPREKCIAALKVIGVWEKLNLDEDPVCLFEVSRLTSKDYFFLASQC